MSWQKDPAGAGTATGKAGSGAPASAAKEKNTGAAAKIKEFKVEISMDNQHWEVAYSGRGALNGRQYFPFANWWFLRITVNF